MKFANLYRKASAFLFLSTFLILSSGAGEDFSRTRHKAALMVLLDYNPVSSLQRDFSCQRAQIMALCSMLVQEGGYVSERAQNILDINDPEVDHVAMLVRELSQQKQKVSRPGPLLLASVMALGYARPEISGLRAAMHLGRMNSVDAQTDILMRATYSLMVNIFEGGIEKKSELLKIAAINADDDGVAKEIRSLRLCEWRKLPDEKTLLGRFCRAMYIWQRTTGWKQAMDLGKKKLRYFESLRFLAVVCAAWEDMHGIPEDFVWRTMQDKQTRQMCTSLHELAANGVLIYIPKSLVEKRYQSTAHRSRESVNGNPVQAGGDQFPQNETAEGKGSEAKMAAPMLPALPGIPASPTEPGRIPNVFADGGGRGISNALPATPETPAAPHIRAPAVAPSMPDVEKKRAAEQSTCRYNPPEEPAMPEAPVLSVVEDFNDFALPTE